MQRKKRIRSRELTSRLQRHAHERAAAEARRIPWQVLLEARNQYLDWQEFYYWARSIMESEHGIPDLLARKLDELCPGFLEAEKQYLRRHPKEATLTPVRLGQWIDERIFGFAKQGGWLLAITFYAVRETRYQKTAACWSESVQQWQQARPIQYPSFEEWGRAAARCDETARLLPAIRKQRACFKLVDAERLAHVTYIDVFNRGLQVMDAAAISLCMDNKLPIIVFDLTRPGNIKRIVLGEPVGSIVSSGG